MPCPFAHALGVPGEGVHSTRIFGLAAFDMFATLLGAIITTFIMKIDLWKTFLFWFILGEVLHYAFGTNTAFLRMIGLTPHCQ
jgi:hypothetical protein